MEMPSLLYYGHEGNGVFGIWIGGTLTMVRVAPGL